MRKIIKAGTIKEPSALELKNRALARRAAAEGFVLLENDGLLPLKPQKLAVYGSGIRKTVKGGEGSGAVRERYSVSIEKGLEDAGFTLTTKTWLDRFDQFFNDTYEKYREEQEEKVKGVQNFYQILGMVTPFSHPTGIPVEDSDIASSDTDTALFVISRQAGEGNDRKDTAGDYQLDETEVYNLKKLSAAYKKLIVVLNVGGLIDLSVLDDVRISALVYFVQGGEEGGNALADVLTGKENFSGKLTVSWPLKFSDVPSCDTYSYLGKDPFAQEYEEGIYVGYRYYDTFDVPVRYPFGYGLSYTSFRNTIREIRQTADGLEVSVCAENTGSCAGREAVLLYVSVPCADEGTEAKRLAAFVKTEKLGAGEAKEYVLAVPYKNLAVYDTASASWLLSAGTYVFLLDDARAAVRLEEEAVIEVCRNLLGAESKVCRLTPPERKCCGNEEIVLTLDSSLIAKITDCYKEQPELTDPLIEQMSVRELAELICGGGTSNPDLQVMAMGASGSTSPKLYEKFGIPNVILSDGPAGLNLTSQIVEMENGEVKSAKIPEVMEAYKRYLFGISKYALMRQMADPSEGTVHYQYATAWPCSQLTAQSFDTELMEEIGDAVGSEMEAFGVTIWLAPGMNIQRNPLCGRTFEYYSEDPVVSGKMAAAIVRGVQKHPGKGMSVKHFAANNCELNRNSSSSNIDEKALREVYLRGFEIAVKESDPVTVMAAYNMINGTYCTNSRELLTDVLRDEWGYQGMVMSDWDSIKADRADCTKPLTADIFKAHSAGCDLVMPGRPDQIEALCKGVESGDVSIADMKRCAVRVLKMIRSNTVLESR